MVPTVFRCSAKAMTASAEAFLIDHKFSSVAKAIADLGLQSLESLGLVCEENTAEELAETLELPVEEMERFLAFMKEHHTPDDSSLELTRRRPSYIDFRKHASSSEGMDAAVSAQESSRHAVRISYCTSGEDESLLIRSF